MGGVSCGDLGSVPEEKDFGSGGNSGTDQKLPFARGYLANGDGVRKPRGPLSAFLEAIRSMESMNRRRHPSSALSKSVVLLNQVTTKFTEGAFQLTLALGDTWAHSNTSRVILYWNGNDRFAHIEKSPSLPSISASFAITRKGIRNTESSCKRARIT